ncbi:MAG: sulfatase [Bacteroidales bacterium]|nr:sulfatase [Bacteroidales bacterium]
MRLSIKICLCAIPLLFIKGQENIAQQSSTGQNVLLIVCDDLNHWVGHLGRNAQVKTPHIDELASRGLTFENAYCNAPQCAPSRTSMFSGLYPFTTGVYANSASYVNSNLKSSMMLGAHMKNNGYFVSGAGKTHTIFYSDSSGIDEYEQKGMVERCEVLDNGKTAGQTWFILDGDDACAEDEKTVRWITERLGRTYDKPFFIMAGLYKPHLKWSIPKKYFDMYPLESVELPPIKKDDLDDLDAEAAYKISGKGVITKDEPELKMKQMVRAYMAAVSYCDAQVGRIMEALDNGPNARNTIVILTSDHGYHLGEKHIAAKRVLWEEANRIPYIWVVPGVTQPSTRSTRTVDLITMYPTICDISGVPKPSHLEGKSIIDLLSKPAAEWNETNITTYRPNNHGIRTEKWRFIQYENGSQELYNELTDEYEWNNLAKDPSYRSVIEDFEKLIPMNQKPYIRRQKVKK